MIDMKLIRDDPGRIIERLLKKEVDCREAVERILVLDGMRRNLIYETEGC
jgi:seryl-tRNA synthetase